MGTYKQKKYSENRRECYRHLSAYFYTPDSGSSPDPGRAEDLVTALQLLSPEGASWAQTMLRERKRSSTENLAAEHARLFIGPFELGAPPYGSVYLERGRRVMGDSTMEVIRLYRKMGLSIPDSFKELPDHVAVELEFMYYLIFKQIEMAQAGDSQRARAFMETQGEFISMYLRSWIPGFCSAILAATDCPFYRSLARCLDIFTEADARYLRSELATVPTDRGSAAER